MNRSKERANSDASSLAFIVHDFESISDGTENRAESKSNSTPHTLRDSNNYDNPSPFEHFTSEYKESELVDTAVDSFSSAADRSEKQRSRCSTEGCTKTVKSRGKCNAHGGGYRCSDEKCSNFAVSHGKCISHGGGKRCSFEGCRQGAKFNSLCWKHGGSIRCKVAGCDRGGKTGGLCWTHGGGKLCMEEGCSTLALKGRRCWAHGGGNRCSVRNCSKAVQSHGNRCRIHYEGIDFHDTNSKI